MIEEEKLKARQDSDEKMASIRKTMEQEHAFRLATETRLIEEKLEREVSTAMREADLKAARLSRREAGAGQEDRLGEERRIIELEGELLKLRMTQEHWEDQARDLAAAKVEETVAKRMLEVQAHAQTSLVQAQQEVKVHQEKARELSSQRKADVEKHRLQMERLLGEHEAARQQLSQELAVAQAQQIQQKDALVREFEQQHAALKQQMAETHAAVQHGQTEQHAAQIKAFRDRQEAEVSALKTQMAQELNEARIEGERAAVLRMELETVAAQLEETVSTKTALLRTLCNDLRS